MVNETFLSSSFKILIECYLQVNDADSRDCRTLGSVCHRLHRDGAVGSGDATPAALLFEIQALPSNLAIVAVDTALVRILLPVTAVSLALAGERRGWGLLNNLPVPSWMAVVASVVLLDVAIYLQHVMFHAVPALWRVHRMHHADLDFDVTTGARFHPIEIVLSMLISSAR